MGPMAAGGTSGVNTGASLNASWVSRATYVHGAVRIQRSHGVGRQPLSRPNARHHTMQSVAVWVNRGFRRVERSAERVIGRVGPLFVGMYIGLVGLGVFVFCTWLC